MPKNNDNTPLDLACFSKSPRAGDTHRFFQPWSGQKKKLKSLGLKGFQIIYPARGAQMSRVDPVAWHVTGKL